MKIPAPAEDDLIAFASDLLIWKQQPHIARQGNPWYNEAIQEFE